VIIQIKLIMNLPENQVDFKSKISKEAWICLLLILSILLIYWQVFDFEFVNYDDDRYVTRNPMVQEGLTLKSVQWAFGSTHAEFWHPLTWLSHMLDCQIFGLNPAGHHFSNLLLHIINTLLLFWILRYATRHLWRSFIVAALFALHPLHVESVAWVAERKDLLSTFFWMMTTLLYVWYAKDPGVNRKLLVIFFYILGLMAKPMLVTLPFVFLLLDFWPLERLKSGSHGKAEKSPPWQQSRALILEKIPLFIITIVFSIVTFIIQNVDRHPGSFGHSLDERLATSLISYIHYLIKTLWPFNLSVFYPYPDSYGIWQAAGAVIFLAGTSFWTLKAAQRYPFLPVGWFWYIGTFLPVIGIVQVGAHAMADRYTYVPLIGIFIVFVWGINELLSNRRHQKTVAIALTSVFIVFFMTASFIQIRYWQNSTLLFENALRSTKNNYLAHNNLGNIYFRNGLIDEALNCYVNAIQIKPGYAVAHGNLGAVLVRKGKIQQAINQFNLALAIDPGQHHARQNLKNTLIARESMMEDIPDIEKKTQSDPENYHLLFELGAMYQSLGQSGMAINRYKRILLKKPQFAPALEGLAGIYAESGKDQEAIAFYKKILEIQPQNAHVCYKIATLHARQKDIDSSRYWLKEALKRGFNNWKLIRSDRNMNRIIQNIVNPQ
jgi:tetratricopeptide (TPR) repeat protein